MSSGGTMLVRCENYPQASVGLLWCSELSDDAKYCMFSLTKNKLMAKLKNSKLNVFKPNVNGEQKVLVQVWKASKIKIRTFSTVHNGNLVDTEKKNLQN